MTQLHESSRYRPTTRSMRFTLSSAFIILLVALFLLKFSPLGTSDRSDKYAQDLFNRFLGDYIYPDTAQNQSLVLLLTDQSLAKYQQGRWPADYTFHGRVLNNLLKHQPRSVFIDFYWMNTSKPGADYLVRVLKRYKRSAVPVYVAVTSTADFRALWPELSDLVIPVSATIDLDASDFVARSYLPYDSARDLPTAAFKLAIDQGVQLSDLKTLPNMQIFWGTRPNAFNESWMESPSDTERSTSSVLTQGFSGLNQNLPYSSALFVRDLLNLVPSKKNSPLGDENQALMEARELIQGKTIFYGGSVSGVQDIVFTPLRDVLPGVFYHAMAFDNLTTWGQGYKADQPHARSWLPTIPLWLLDSVALLFVILPVCLYEFRGMGRPFVTRVDAKLALSPEQQQQFVARFARSAQIVARLSVMLCHLTLRTFCAALPIILLSSWILFCAWVGFDVFNLAAASWVGYAGVITLGFMLDKTKWLQSCTTLWLDTQPSTSQERPHEPKFEEPTPHVQFNREENN
ncbi:CHASE2 domain-containing protein [Marinobacterium litorale]|uniref:CHASE2 domain-containing protein n=1 Tax=Marinobacterium litorale TaxID=404770 RepID=UPI000411FBE0|nr:CHASE2 domain-containing protein [Marinobacterium litorale]